MSVKTLLLTAVAIFAISACNHPISSKQISQNDTLIGKRISFPGNLLVLEGKCFRRVDSILPSISNKTRIISIVDGTCMSCVINQLNRVDSVFQDIVKDKRELIIVLNVPSTDSAFFMRNLQPGIKAKGVILWDNSFNFERKNKLFTPDPNLRTFMLDAENKIVLYGNPLYYPDLQAKYTKLIRTKDKTKF